MSIVGLARPEIRALSVYEAAAQVDGTVRLNANESPQSSTIGNFRRPLNRYPELRPLGLQRALATRFGCLANRLLVTRGSSEAIDLLVRTFCRAGRDSILIPAPSFSMYKHYAKVQGATVTEVAMRAERDFSIDVDALLSECTANTRIIFVCSPNNPTGTPLPRPDLVRLLKERNNQSAIVVDEAYIEYSEQRSAMELLNEYPSLVVLRTLSKALGFAGARCGAVAASAEIIHMLNAVQAPYALATPVIECVEDALRDDHLANAAATVAAVVKERQRVMAAISEYDFVQKVWPSDANFFLVRVRDATAVMQRCAERHVLLRRFTGDLSDCIRISIGGTDDNDRLLHVLGTLEPRE